MKNLLSKPLLKIIVGILFISLFGTLNIVISQDDYPIISGFFGLLLAISFLSFVYFILHYFYSKFHKKNN